MSKHPSKKRAKSQKKPHQRAKKIKSKPKKKKKRLTSSLLPAIPQTFKQLQKTWYSKLASTGFIDLETLDSHGTQDGLLNNKGSQALGRLAKAYNKETETYFRRIQNYITHNPNWAHNKAHNLIAQLYANGISYRKMLPRLKAIDCITSIWSINKVIKTLETRAKSWNRINPEGLDFESDFETVSIIA